MLLRIIVILVAIHIFFGWEWLGDITSGQSRDTRRAALVESLDEYASQSPAVIDLVDLGERLPNITDVQLQKIETTIRGSLVTSSGPIYDIQSSGQILGLDTYEVTVWAATIFPLRLPIRGNCIARNDQEKNMLEALSVGQEVRITGEVNSLGRILGVSLQNCIVKLK